MSETQSFVSKSYAQDFLPQAKGRFHQFGRYDFSVPEGSLRLNLKLDVSNDKYLLDYMRMHVVNKGSVLQTEDARTYYTKETGLQTYGPGDYSLLIEGTMPYNTTEGQLQIEAFSDSESFELTEIQLCEPIEFTDAYVPSKYGIIFKEKIFVGEPTNVTMHLRLKQEGVELASKEMRKLFKVELFDNGERVHLVEGYDQLSIPNILFNNSTEEATHAYVL